VPQKKPAVQQSLPYQTQPNQNLLDITESGPVINQPITQPNIQEASLIESQQPTSPGIFNFFDDRKAEKLVYQNIAIPVV
jgi:hypothetical protein